jgi:hypothetical protein
MRRIITSILLLFLTVICAAQTAPPISQGSKYYQFRNSVRIDSALFLPRRDTFITDASLKAAGMITYRPDGTVWYFNGSYWNQVSPGSGNFIKNDTVGYQNAGFSISLPGKINYITDTTGQRYGALEVYRTISNPDYKAPQNIRSVFRVYSTEAGHEDKELTGMYAGLHIDALNTQQYTNNTEGIIGVATTVSNFGNGNIALMSGFSAAGGHSSTATGIIDRWMFFRGTGYNTHSNPGKLNNLVGVGFAKLTAGGTSNINFLTGIGDIDGATGTRLIGNIPWPAGNWHMFDSSGYKSYFRGSLMLGDLTDTTYKFRVAGRTYLDDTLRVPRVVGGMINTDKLTFRNYSNSLSPVSIDSNGIALGTTSGIAGTLLNISKIYASPTTNVTSMRVTPQVYETLTTHSSGLIAATFQPIITGANNKSWGAGAVQGISVAPTISAGASGTIPNIYAETVTKTFNASSAIVDTFVYKRTYPSAESTPSTVNHIIYDLVGVGLGVGGHWSRYDATTYNSYWGTGNQLINTNSDNGFGEKLQVNGRVDASRATRGSNLITKDQLDSLSASTSTFVQNLSIAAGSQAASFNISGQGQIAGSNAYKMFLNRANRTVGGVVAFKTGTDTSGYVGLGSLLSDDVMLVGLKDGAAIRTRDTSRIRFGSHSPEYTYMMGKKGKWKVGDSVLTDPTLPFEVESAQDTSILTAHKIIGNGLISNSSITVNGGYAGRIVTVSGTSYSPNALDWTIICTNTNTVTITLPDATTASGRIYHIKKGNNSANPVNINTTSSQNIDATTTAAISTSYGFLTVVSNGTQWYILNN